MKEHNGNIIILDDVTSLRQRVTGAVVLVILVAAIALPFALYMNADGQDDPTPASRSHQNVADMCGQWDVPAVLQPIANAAYPSWNWVCHLVRE